MSSVDEVTTAYVSTDTTPTITLDSTPTSGNLLVCAATTRTGAADIAITSSGWTTEENHSTGGGTSWTSLFAYKVSDGTETNVVFSADDGAHTSIVVVEFSGIASPTMIASNENETYIAGSSDTISSNAATPTGDGTAITMFSGVAGNAFNSMSAGGSFTICNDGTDDASEHDLYSGSKPCVHVASYDYTGTSDQSCTWTTTDIGPSHCYAAIMVFQPDTASIVPQVAHHSNIILG